MRTFALIYGGIVYLLFFASFIYLVVFLGADMLAFLDAPKTINVGEPAQTFAAPALTNIVLLLLFGVSHTVMARPGFKAVWTKIIPIAIEHSTYVLVSTFFLVLLYHFWRPMPEVIWSTGPGLWSGVMTLLFFAGFGIVLLSTFLISHFDLFGLRQVWHHFQNTDMPNEPFKTPLLYAITRHPLYLGFVIAFWATPTMTAGHLLFASVWTAYIFVAIGYEERDLITHFGDDYRKYMARVPMLFPFGVRKD